MTDIYPLAIRYAAELSTMFDDVRELLEEVRGEEKDLPALTRNSPSLVKNSPSLVKKNGSPTPSGKLAKVC